MNNINNNSYGNNLYDKPSINAKNEVDETQSLSISNNSMEKVPYEELVKLDKVQNEMLDSFFKKIQQDNERAEQIVIKLVKGDKVTKEELEFISKKYPQIKQLAEQSLKESKDLKVAIKNCNTPQEREQLIAATVKKIRVSLKKGTITELEAKIKTVALKEVIELSEEISKNDKKAEIISEKIVKGEKLAKEEQSFINEKYPRLSQKSERLNKEINFLKLQLKQYNDVEREKLVLKIIKDIDNKLKNNEISPNEVYINNVAKKEILKLFKNIETELKNLEKIYTKIIKGESLTSREEDFINKNYPEIKKIPEEVTKEIAKKYIIIKEELSKCKTQEEKVQVIYNRIEKHEEFTKEGTIADIYSRLKMIVLEDLKSNCKDKRNESEIKYNLNPYIYLNSKLLLEKGRGIIIAIALISTIYFLGKTLI